MKTATSGYDDSVDDCRRLTVAQAGLCLTALVSNRTSPGPRFDCRLGRASAVQEPRISHLVTKLSSLELKLGSN